MVPHAQMFKNRLQEFAQKRSLPLPVYHTVNDGKDHLPQFKSSVTINGTEYESPSVFRHKKEAQNAAAKEAVEDLQTKGFKFKERKWPKCLIELASMKNMPLPTYHFTKSVTATVEINGTSYTGAPANNLKKAANKAALEAICAIDPQYYKQHGSEEIEGKQQSSQELDPTGSISKRTRIESGNAEQMSQRRKKHKGEKSNRNESGNADQMSQRRKKHKGEKSNDTA